MVSKSYTALPPAENISNGMPSKIPNTVIMCIWEFNLRSFMPANIKFSVIVKKKEVTGNMKRD